MLGEGGGREGRGREGEGRGGEGMGRGGGEERGRGEFGVGRCKLLHLEWLSNEVLLCSTGNYIQSLGVEYDRR